MTGHTIGMTREEDAVQPSNNHQAKTASISPKLAREIAELGLTRIAGNSYICRAEKTFWQVADGKIRRLTLTEVDNGDELPAASATDPDNFLQHALSDLSF
jgi:hypothetical protein